MKFRSVQRAVRAQRFGRAAGDAPNIGRVSRMPGTGLPRGRRRKRRRGESGKGNRQRNNRKWVMIAWSSLLVLLAVGALGVALVSWVRHNMKRSATAAGVVVPELVAQSRVTSRFESPTEKEALALVTRALAIRETGQVDECFRTGSTSSGQVIDFLRTLAEREGTVEGLTWLSSMDANGLLIDGVLVKTSGHGKPLNRLALLTPDEEGTWKIDFEAFARSVSPPWPELLNKMNGEGLVRVIVAVDSYFNGPFRDDLKWACFGMVSPDTDVIMLGYCQRGSPQEAALMRIIAGDDSGPGYRVPRRATLEIRRVEGAEVRQFEISRVVAEDWVVAEKRFDENFE